MLTRRHFIASGLALAATPSAVLGHAGLPHTSLATMTARNVEIRRDVEVGTIHIFPSYFCLYHVRAPGWAREYHVAVGDEGRNLEGETFVRRKVEWPSWTPTQSMIEREPEVYGRFSDGMPGGPGNPLGARALYLYQDGHDTLYRIHGTFQPETIGRAVSSGCIRLTNPDVIELYPHVELGSRVISYL